MHTRSANFSLAAFRARHQGGAMAVDSTLSTVPRRGVARLPAQLRFRNQRRRSWDSAGDSEFVKDTAPAGQIEHSPTHG